MRFFSCHHQVRHKAQECLRYLLLCIFLGNLVIPFQATAQQNFSVKLIATVQPPNSPYLADYTYAQSLNLNIILSGRTFYQGILKIRLESMDGRGIVLQTRATYNPIVDLGPSQTFTGVELAPYFSQENLDFIGFDRQQYLRTKRIPDGVYRLIFSFFDRFRPDVLVSNVDILSQKILRVFALQPPLINLPLHMGTVNPANQSAQPVNINWTRPANTPFTPEYEMIINELRPECQSTYNGLNTGNAAASRVSQAELFNCLGPEIYRTTTTSLTYSYGMQAEPLLGLGKWYSIRIQARDPQGRTLFINNGISQIRVFRYGKPCDPPPRVRVKALNPYQVQLDWDALSTHTSYTVHFKKEGENQEWYSQRAISNRAQINDLEPGTYYSFRVSADCNAFSSEQGATTDLRMPSPVPSQVQCGKDLVVDLSNQTPIQALQAGQKIIVGDFEFTLTEVRPLGSGWFAGKAYTNMKLFQGARVYARFDRIKINTDRRLIDGELISTGAGVQLVPDEWKNQYLSFTNEINRLFNEIDKGLDKLDAALGKIDEVLKKIDEWLVNYQGEDKAELLETIRIGKKEIEEGKEAIDKKDVANGLKKLKDGSGKVLGVGAKVVKDRLKQLFGALKELILEVIQNLKGKSEQEVAQNEKEQKTQDKEVQAAIQKVKEERIALKIGEKTGGNESSQLTILPIYEAPLEVDVPEEEWKKRRKNKTLEKWSKARDKLISIVEKLQIERFKFDTLGKMSGAQILQTLQGNIEKDVKDLGQGLLQNFMEGDGKEAMKQFIRKFISEKLDERIKVIYKKD
ncbi:MAG TPA: hypothetical protein DCS93_32945 [Microscillaceae bacterium]|nr:hypothetical protein [Microscillaceae bacterium]